MIVARIGSRIRPPVSPSCGPPLLGTGEPEVVCDTDGVHCALSVVSPSTSEPAPLLTPPGSASGNAGAASAMVGRVTVRPRNDAVANLVRPWVCVDFDGVPIAMPGGVNVTPGTLLRTDARVEPTVATALVTAESCVDWPSTSIDATETSAVAFGVLAATALVMTFTPPSDAIGSPSALTAASTWLTRSCNATRRALTADARAAASTAAAAAVARVASVAPNAV